MKIPLRVNGEAVEVEAEPNEMLLAVLRRELGLNSVRQTCGVGVCGACTVLVDGEPVSACILLALLARDAEITTVEGLGGDHPVQQAFVEAHAFQCGYCIPGMVLTAGRLLEEDPEPTEEKVKNYMGGNLCRCGSYAKVVDAINLASDRLKNADEVLPPREGMTGRRGA